MSHLAFSEEINETIEPAVKGTGTIDLLESGTLDAWRLPATKTTHWRFDQSSIIGTTGTKKLKIPEWLYTKKRFSDFEFTCELKLTGDNRSNTGIYYRVTTFLFEHKSKGLSFEAPSGYECDAAFQRPGRNSNWGSLGNWYARPSLRIFADQSIINQVYKPKEWNRMTIRARGNRLEYWINGMKVMNYVDHDPSGAREGSIGIQIHDGSVMKVECRNIRVRPLDLQREH